MRAKARFLFAAYRPRRNGVATQEYKYQTCHNFYVMTSPPTPSPKERGVHFIPRHEGSGYSKQQIHYT